MVCLFCLRPTPCRAHDADEGGGDGDDLQHNTADTGGGDQAIVQQAQRRGDQQAVTQDLGLAKGDEKRVGHQCHDQQQGQVALPEPKAQRAHSDHKDGRHRIVSLGVFLYKKAAKEQRE